MPGSGLSGSLKVARIALTSALIGVASMMTLIMPSLFLIAASVIGVDVTSKVLFGNRDSTLFDIPLYITKAPELLYNYLGGAITGHSVRVGDVYPFVGEAIWGGAIAVVIFIRKLRQVRANS
jgi:hypothetical protein